jgi:hypothetical protein
VGGVDDRARNGQDIINTTRPRLNMLALAGR